MVVSSFLILHSNLLIQCPRRSRPPSSLAHARDDITSAAMALSRRQVGFLIRFAVLCVVFYLPIAVPALERVTVAPFTRALTEASGATLRMIGQKVTTEGTIIRGGMFAVDIKNGCNAVEAVAFLAAAILAFEAPIVFRVIGAIAGSFLLELLNLIRIDTLRSEEHTSELNS